jgi:hypothetical protein
LTKDIETYISNPIPSFIYRGASESALPSTPDTSKIVSLTGKEELEEEKEGNKDGIGEAADNGLALSKLLTGYADNLATRMLFIAAQEKYDHECFRNKSWIYSRLLDEHLHPYLYIICKLGIENGKERLHELVRAHAFCCLQEAAVRVYSKKEEKTLECAVQYLCSRTEDCESFVNRENDGTDRLWDSLWNAFIKNYCGLCIILEVSKASPKLPITLIVSMLESLMSS